MEWPDQEKLKLLRELYPEIPEEQLWDVKERLDAYFEVVLKIFLEQQKKKGSRKQ